MHQETGYYVVVTERPDPTIGMLGKLPRFVSNRISSLFNSQVISEIRMDSGTPTSLADAQWIATRVIEKGPVNKITETTILPEYWPVLNARELRRYNREAKKYGATFFEVKR